MAGGGVQWLSLGDTTELRPRTPTRRSSLFETLGLLGPGLAVAATGVGAGDVVSAAVAGARFGMVVLWAAAAGALIKYVLNEGIARWQLATGTTLLEGWGRYLHKAVLYGFLVYLVLWTIIVAAAQMSACGLAAHALIPAIPVPVWGALHSVVCVGMILAGRYGLFERVMKAFIALMFATVIVAAVLIRPDLGEVAGGIVSPAVPLGSGPFLLGVIGGVGGSVTLLSYGYWIRERGWEGAEYRRVTRLDLGSAYTLTGLFGLAMIVIAAGIKADAITGNAMALTLADRIGEVAGAPGRLIFLVGFWGAVATSMLGVWQGVPYIFADLMRSLRPEGAAPDASRTAASVDTSAPLYRWYLLFIAFPPMLLLLVGQPVWILLIYTITGAFFMPFLAATLLYLNNRAGWLRELRNGWLANGLLVVALALFGYLCVNDLASRF